MWHDIHQLQFRVFSSQNDNNKVVVRLNGDHCSRPTYFLLLLLVSSGMSDIHGFDEPSNTCNLHYSDHVKKIFFYYDDDLH